jgi:hypothetical protein
MLSINITQFIADAVPQDYSASVAEIGENAGRYTWQAACEDSEDWNFLDNDEKREAFRKFVQSSGGWSDEEIARWTDEELNALCIQWISGDIRECLEWDVDDVWLHYQELSEAGRVPSSLYRDDDGQVYWTRGE